MVQAHVQTHAMVSLQPTYATSQSSLDVAWKCLDGNQYDCKLRMEIQQHVPTKRR